MTGRRKGPSRHVRSSRSRGGTRRWLWVLLAAVLLVGAAVPASSFDTARLDRSSTIGVVADADGLLGIDHSQSVSKPSDTLVVVTNRFQADRVITVALTTCTANGLSLPTTGENSDGVLLSNDGSAVTFRLPADGSQAVSIAVNDVQCAPIVTRTTTTDGLIHVTAERETSPAQGKNGNGNENGNGSGNGNGNGSPDLRGVLGDG